jgi:hypothetical protein
MVVPLAIMKLGMTPHLNYGAHQSRFVISVSMSMPVAITIELGANCVERRLLILAAVCVVGKRKAFTL